MTIPWITSANVSVLFGRPFWLILVPVLAILVHLWSRRSLAGLGRWRRRIALATRLAVVALVVAALVLLAAYSLSRPAGAPVPPPAGEASP